MFYSPTYQRWIHSPIAVAKRVTAGAALGTVIATGNYKTRKYRQKPIVVLEKSTHQPNPNRKNPKKIVKTTKETPKVLRLRGGAPEIYPGFNRGVNSFLPTSNPKMVKTTKRTYKKGKKSYGKRRRRLPPLALPASKVVRMRAVCAAVMNSTAGACGVATIKVNSLNDSTGAFSQILPCSLDQWAAQYQKYKVLGAKVTITAGPTSQTGPGIIGLHLADNTTALTSASHYKSLPNTVSKIVTTYHDLAKLTIKYSAKKFWKLTNIRDDTNQEANFSLAPNDPTDVAYVHVFAQDLVGSSNFNTDAQIQVEFIVLLTDPITLAESSL